MTDHLRRNPLFYNEIREDAVIVQEDADTITFAKLLFVFQCSINNDQGPYSLALVQGYDAFIPRSQRPPSDAFLELIRVRAQPRNKPRLIFVDSIVRGAMLASANDAPNDYLVVDVVDTDMFSRLRGWSPNRWTL